MDIITKSTYIFQNIDIADIMDLVNFLKLTFPNKLTYECEEMIDNLRKLSISCVKDLKYLDEHALIDLANFTRYEAKKLIDWITNPGLVFQAF